MQSYEIDKLCNSKHIYKCISIQLQTNLIILIESIHHIPNQSFDANTYYKIEPPPLSQHLQATFKLA